MKRDRGSWRLWKSCCSALVLLGVLGSASAEAQPVTIPRFDFSFSNPGARSLGFGGAFAALADDATAAYANPAGLVQLTEREVSIEARRWDRSPAFLAGGRADGEPTGIGIDTRRSLVFSRDHSDDLGPSFAAVVIPRGRWSLAFYGHQLAKFETRAESQGIFTAEGFFPPLLATRSPASLETVDLDIVSAGLAAGWRMNDELSLGLGLVFSDASLSTRSGLFLPDDESEQSQYGEVSFLPERRFAQSDLSIEGTDLSFNAGALWRISEQLSAGLFYRQGAKVEGTADFEIDLGPIFPGLPSFGETFRNEAILDVPDVAGAGLAYRSKDGRVTLATEVDHVGYRDFLRVVDNEDLEVEGSQYEDAWEYHFGAEYALLQSTPIVAFRAGVWIEPEGEQLLEEGDVTHLSAGLGLAASRFQIDLAGDFSDRGDTASLSFIYGF